MKCNFEWKGPTGPTQCPICGHLYVKWTNFEEMRKMWEIIENNKNKE